MPTEDVCKVYGNDRMEPVGVSVIEMHDGVPYKMHRVRAFESA